MKIVHLITGTTVGGAERALARLIQRSNSVHYHHQVISMAEVGLVGAELQKSGVQVYSLHLTRGRNSPFGLLRLIRLLGKLQPDVLHCWMYHANLLGLIAARLAGVRRVIWGIRCSEIDFARYSRLTRWVVMLGARLSGRPETIVVNSGAGAKVHAKWGYDKTKIVVISNGFNLEQFKPDDMARRSVREELGLVEDTLLIGLVARYDPMKDHETFFTAVRLASLRHSNVHFILCGNEITPENTSLARMLQQSGVGDRVHLLGPRNDIPRLSAAFDVAASSSAFGEGFCNALGEAMSCGVPCVTTEVGDAARIVGETGKIVPPRDPQALAAAWTELLQLSPQQRKELGSKAREHIRENFSMEKFQRQHEMLYARSRPSSH